MPNKSRAEFKRSGNSGFFLPMPHLMFVFWLVNYFESAIRPICLKNTVLSFSLFLLFYSSREFSTPMPKHRIQISRNAEELQISAKNFKRRAE